jgi:hypothetical protein
VRSRPAGPVKVLPRHHDAQRHAQVEQPSLDRVRDIARIRQCIEEQGNRFKRYAVGRIGVRVELPMGR